MQKETVGIIFNGPPGSGKDTACEYLHRAYQARYLSFKQELYNIAATVAGVSLKLMVSLATDRSTKEVPNKLFVLGGVQVSPRNWLIYVSENVVKPLLGSDYFGKQAASRVQPGVNVSKQWAIQLTEGNIWNVSIDLDKVTAERKTGIFVSCNVTADILMNNVSIGKTGNLITLTAGTKLLLITAKGYEIGRAHV